MTDTANLGLALLDAAQAQKHVTVNEALARIDAVLPASVASRTAGVPVAPADGQAHVVPTGASGAWAGKDGKVALFLNGGWEFLDPWAGWTLWVADEAVRITWVGRWLAAGIAHAPGGAATLAQVIRIDHTIGTGGTSTVTGAIPDKAVVIGVTARVIAAIGGALNWAIGVAGATDRYGTGYGPAKNSFARGVTGAPVTYYGATNLLLTAAGGNFSGGQVRLGIHCLTLVEPDAVP